MMPVVASMLVGGVASAMAAQGLGGLMAQNANIFAANACLTPPAPPPASGPAAMASAMMQNWMKIIAPMMAVAKPPEPTANGAALKAGLDAFESPMKAGVQVTQAQQKTLNDLLDSLPSVDNGQPDKN